MGLFTKKSAVGDAGQSQLELRRTMQDIVIAHAAVCYRHMTPAQFRAVQAEWARVVKGKGWAPFFADDSHATSPSPWLAAEPAAAPTAERGGSD